mgnify:FL=1|jgi:hypothetical protein
MKKQSLKKMSKNEQRKFLAESLAQFVADGKTVTVCPPQKTPRLATTVRVGD